MPSPMLYFRESKHYTYSEIQSRLGTGITEEETDRLIGILKKYNLLKLVSKDTPEFSQLSDQDYIIGEPIENDRSFVYAFTFVGVILLNNYAIKCYPKYIDNVEESVNGDFIKQFKQILKVIERYNQKEQLVYLYNGESENKVFNRLSISLHILKDYFENGLYTNTQELIEINGSGEILWEKTISDTFALIKNNTPYYFDLYTIDNTQNDLDYIKRLHECIISECSRLMESHELDTLFDIPLVELSHEKLTDFGDKDYILYRLEAEIKHQFVTKKQSILKTLYAYVAETKSNQRDDSLSLFGTNTFNLVWEKACGEVLGSVNRDTKITSLAPIVGNECLKQIPHDSRIGDFFELPQWFFEGEEVSYQGDLIPDILVLRKTAENNSCLYILDGKYYLIKKDTNRKISGNPSVQDVVKQYVYHGALQTLVSQLRIANVANAFLIPALTSEHEKIDSVNESGSVPYWTMQRSMYKELPTIQVIKLKADKVWEAYLAKLTLDETIWNKIRVSPTKYYLYHSENDTSVPCIDDGKTHVLVGFLRSKYFQQVEEKSSSEAKSSFTFYFYATKKMERFPMHPFIDACTEFIGYTTDKSKYIRGTLVKTKTGRCKIDEVTSDALEKIVGGEHKSAETYYTVEVKDFEIVSTPYKGIDDYNCLKKEIENNGLNKLLYKYSPNVIDLQKNRPTSSL